MSRSHPTNARTLRKVQHLELASRLAHVAVLSPRERRRRVTKLTQTARSGENADSIPSTVGAAQIFCLQGIYEMSARDPASVRSHETLSQTVIGSGQFNSWQIELADK